MLQETVFRESTRHYCDDLDDAHRPWAHIRLTIGASVEINVRFLLLPFVLRVDSSQNALEEHGLIVPMCFIVDVGLGASHLYLGWNTHRFLPVPYANQGGAPDYV